MFGRLNITLVRAISRAILATNVVPNDFNSILVYWCHIIMLYACNYSTVFLFYAFVVVLYIVYVMKHYDVIDNYRDKIYMYIVT